MPKGAGRQGSVLAITLASVVGLGIAYPLLTYQATALGASAQAVTLLLALDTAVILLAAPLAGRLSDHIGRKPVILAGLACGITAYLVMAHAGSLSWLYLSRALAGLSLTATSVLQAYVADRTEPQERALAMSKINGCFGLAFVVGPLVLWATVPFAEPFAALAPGWFSEFSLASYAAVASALIAFGLAAGLLQSDLPSAQRRVTHAAAPLRQIASLLGTRRILLPLAVLVLVIFVHEGAIAVFGLWAIATQASEMDQVAALFAITGGGAFAAPLLFRFARGQLRMEREFVGFGIAAIALGLVALVIAGQSPLHAHWLLGAAMSALGLGVVLVLSSVQGLISCAAPASAQGAMLGIGHGAASFARVCGPLWSGFLFAGFYPSAPFTIGTLVLAVSVVLLWMIPVPVRQPTGGLASGAARRKTKQMEPSGV